METLTNPSPHASTSSRLGWTPRRFALLCLFFFLSGAAALGVEVVWARILQRILGSTALSVATVLAGFLGGLGLGAALADRALAWLRRPLRAYALAEMAAAVAAAVGTLVLLSSQGLLRLPAPDVWWVALVFVGSTPLGATLPLAVASLGVDVGGGRDMPAVDAEVGRFERRVRRLYGWNALGGCCGAAGIGLAVLPLYGEWRAVLCCVAMEGAVAAAAVGLARRLESIEREGEASGGGPHVHRSPGEYGAVQLPAPGVADAARAPAQVAGGGPDLTLRAVAVFVFLSGFLVFYWEVLWTRLLALTIGATAYAFAVVSSSVLLGIAFGSLLVGGKWLRRHGGWLLPLLVATFLAVGYFRVPFLADAYLWGVRLWQVHPLAWGCLGAGAIAFFPNALLGGLFPWLVARRARLVGRLYALNAAGSVAGAFCGGPLAAEFLALEDAYRWGVAGLVALTVPGLWLAREPVRARGTSGGRLVAVTFVTLFAAVFVLDQVVLRASWDSRRLLSGVYQWSYQDLTNPSVSLADRQAARELLAVVPGREVLVSVEAERGINTVFVRGNGKAEGSVPLDPEKASLADLPTQILLGELPLNLLHGVRRPRVLLIGLGSGVTLGAMFPAGAAAPGRTAAPRPQVDVVEIEAAFYEAIRRPEARLYLEPFVPRWLLENEDSARAGGCEFHFGDARRLLGEKLYERRWDVMVSQPSEPWIPGATHLFTEEFFRQAATHLEKDGVFLQWLQMYKIRPTHLATLVRTFRQVFPKVYLLRPPATGELLLAGAQAALPLERLLAAPEGPHTRRTGLILPVDRLAMFLAGPRGVDSWVGLEPGLPIHRDGRSAVLFGLTHSLYSQDYLARENLRRLRRVAGSDPISRYLPAKLQADPVFLRVLAERNHYLGDFEEALAILEGDSSAAAENLRRRCREELEK